ncbi:gamma-glutamyltransferase [Niveispirillum sp.]|uniref:gamma-glutamyltransferase n=1 Tax=Niveispirillum sp. TaxID=1917217 RepID=UPI001B5B19C2|nr:gamma-glutamyltransferase [Niveispirillum sp.]MBP7334580.1 gamma-glutamyltransferase [Niveispirillum sp.]
MVQKTRRGLAALLLGALSVMPIITETAVAADYVDGAQAGRGDRLVGANFAGRSEIIARNGAAATSQPLATQVALSILQQGGSAVDAAIAANATLGLVEPTGSGMGGDLFALIWDPRQNKVVGLNASGRAPKGQTLDDLVKRLGPGKMIPSHGSLSVTVPGAVAGWFELHKKYGKLPMEKVLAPAIAYANDGFPLSPFIAKGWAANFRRFDQMGGVIEELDNARKTYLIDGKAPVAGQVFRNPDLAKSLAIVAKGGHDAYYKGPIAKTIDAYMKRIGGPLRYEDFADFKAQWVEPISTNYRGYDIWQIPPNGQGLATLQMLNILEGYDLKAMGHNSADFIHVSVEAKKLAFADRSRWYADPEFVKLPISTLISKEYAAKRRAQIDMKKAGAPETGIMPESHDTIFLSTADKDGLMVALIQSNYRGMGSGLVPDGLGFMLQDRGEQFALDPSHPNVYAPGKRPFHTIIPGFVTKDNQPFAAYGVMGGGMQPQGHTQVLVNMIDFGMNVQEAGDAARWQHEGSPEPTGEAGEGIGIVYVEQGVSPAVIEELKKRGHKVEVKPGLHYGSYEAIVRDHPNGVYRAGTEMRVDGHAAGY